MILLPWQSRKLSSSSVYDAYCGQEPQGTTYHLFVRQFIALQRPLRRRCDQIQYVLLSGCHQERDSQCWCQDHPKRCPKSCALNHSSQKLFSLAQQDGTLWIILLQPDTTVGSKHTLPGAGIFSVQHAVYCTKASCNTLWKASGQSVTPSQLCLSPTQLTVGLVTSANLVQATGVGQEYSWPVLAPTEKGQRGRQNMYTSWTASPFNGTHYISVKLFIYNKRGL